MISYYRFHPKLRMFDPAAEALKAGDVVCHEERTRSVRSASPLRLERRGGGGGLKVGARRQVVLMPEYSRPYPQKLAIAAPSAVREAPPVDMNEACEHIGLAIGQALQLRLPLDLQALFEDTRDTVLLRELLSIEHPFELGHYGRVLRECRGSPPQRARCFRALLLGRCLDHAKNDPARAFGILRRCTEAAPRLGARDLAAPMDPGPVRDQDLRGAFVSILRMVVPRAQMRVVVSPGGARRLAVLDPSSCALALDRLMHRLRRGAEQEEEEEVA